MFFILRYFSPISPFLSAHLWHLLRCTLVPIDRLRMLAGTAGDKNDEVIRVFNSTGSWAARWARGKINIYTTSLEGE